MSRWLVRSGGQGWLKPEPMHKASLGASHLKPECFLNVGQGRACRWVRTTTVRRPGGHRGRVQAVCSQSPSAVILEPKKIKCVTVSIVSPSICHEVMGLDAMILVPRLGIEPVSSVLESRFLITGPPGKSPTLSL